MTVSSNKGWLRRIRQLVQWALIVAMASTASLAFATVGQPIYWLNFEDGDGVPDITPGGGTLGLWNSPGVPDIVPEGGVAFSAADGVFGGSLNANVNQSYGADPTGYAWTRAGTSVAFPNAGVLNQVTVTVWIKSTTEPSNSFGRIWALAPDSTDPLDITSAGAIGIDFQNSASRRRPEVASNMVVNNPLTAGIGNQVTKDEWTFIALSYDGTSTNGNNSTVQSDATGGLSTLNGQVYMGTNAAAVTRYELGMTVTTRDADDASGGPLNFTEAGTVLLANRSATGRGFIGFIDDFRVYDSVLTPLEVENVRQQGLLGNTTAPVQLLGDYNADNSVDAADYVVWRKNPDSHGGDPDGYNTWRSQFGVSLGEGTLNNIGVVVPEPGAALALIGAMILAGQVLRRRT
ncbi:MAG: hypothetical protein WD468_03335 [Pirellulales bacterium]